jgi:hypothetical protein
VHQIITWMARSTIAVGGHRELWKKSRSAGAFLNPSAGHRCDGCRIEQSHSRSLWLRRARYTRAV